MNWCPFVTVTQFLTFTYFHFILFFAKNCIDNLNNAVRRIE